MPTSRSLRLSLLAATTTVLALSVTVALPATAATHAAVPQSSIVRLVAQQGLAIGEASNVLQGNLLLVEVGAPGDSGSPGCFTLPGGGSDKRLSYDSPSDASSDVVNRIYYDSTCVHPYVTQTAHFTEQQTSASLLLRATESWTYTGPKGNKLGVFTAKASAADSADGLKLAGVGTFTPVAKRPKVSLGLTCLAKSSEQTDTSSTWHCAGGVAQSFAALKTHVGSITPLTLRIAMNSDGSFGKVAFAGSASTLRAGGKTMTVGLTKSGALTLLGTSSKVGSDATKGQAAKFAVFTPRPTGWTVTDAARHTAFSISVANSSLGLAGSVIDATSHKKYATFSLDRSGTGTIRYAGSRTSTAVTSWMLAG